MQNMSVVFGQQSVECSQCCCEVQDGPQQAAAHWTGTAYADLLVWAGHESLGLEEGLESSGPAKHTGSSLVEMTPSWGCSGRHGGVLLWQSPFFSLLCSPSRFGTGCSPSSPPGVSSCWDQREGARRRVVTGPQGHNAEGPLCLGDRDGTPVLTQALAWSPRL